MSRAERLHLMEQQITEAQAELADLEADAAKLEALVASHQLTLEAQRASKAGVEALAETKGQLNGAQSLLADQRAAITSAREALATLEREHRAAAAEHQLLERHTALAAVQGRWRAKAAELAELIRAEQAAFEPLWREWRDHAHAFWALAPEALPGYKLHSERAVAMRDWLAERGLDGDTAYYDYLFRLPLGVLRPVGKIYMPDEARGIDWPEMEGVTGLILTEAMERAAARSEAAHGE